jgi:hypothetical protein
MLFGWGVAMLLTLRDPFRRGEREGWNLIAIPVLAWFVPDAAFSLRTGVWHNAVLNAVFSIPLVATRGNFR